MNSLNVSFTSLLLRVFRDAISSLTEIIETRTHMKGRRSRCANLPFCRTSHRRFSERKGVLSNLAKFTGKHLCQSFFFNKVTGLGLGCGTGVFLWMLRNFSEHLFYRTYLGDCFCPCQPFYLKLLCCYRAESNICIWLDKDKDSVK